MAEDDPGQIVIAKDFSAYPGGRDEGDGPDHGRRFRQEVLAPKLRAAVVNGRTLTVSLDGVLSFGSSFLEEAFGGLVRAEGFKKKDVQTHLKIVATQPGSHRYLSAIERYIQRA